MDILEKARLAGLHIVVWFNARGVFLTVHTESADDTEEEMLVDAKWFASEKEMKSFARQNFPDWQRAQQSVQRTGGSLRVGEANSENYVRWQNGDLPEEPASR